MKKIYTLLLLCFTAAAHAQWTPLNTGITEDLYAIYQNTDQSRVITCGNGHVYLSTNQGNTWTEMGQFAVPADSVIFRRSLFSDVYAGFASSVLYVCGYDPLTGNGVVFNSSSQAPTVWRLTLNTPQGRILSINEYDGTRMVATGENGIFMRSTQGSTSWTQNTAYTSTKKVYDYTRSGTTTGYFTADSAHYRMQLVSNTLTSYSHTYNIKKIDLLNNTLTGITANGIVAASTSAVPFAYQPNTFYNGPIQPTGVTQDYISTTNGLLKKSNQAWEWVISTQGMQLNDVKHRSLTTPYGYACGNNGLILKRTGTADVTRPYVNFSAPVGMCVGQSLSLAVAGNTTYSYRWYINNTQVSTASSYTYTFATAGTYQIKLKGTNGAGVSDSITKTVTVVPVPSNQFGFTLMDSLLCKTGNAEVVVHNSNPDYTYTVRKFTGGAVVYTGTGNGGDVSLYTGTLTDSTRYRVWVTPTIANCAVANPLVFEVGVEKTKALFSAGLVNAYPGEPVTFYNTSRQAAAYEWSFLSGTPQLAQYTATGRQPFSNTFADTGWVDARLVAVSAHGCRDTLRKNAVYGVEFIDLVDDCNVLVYKGTVNTHFGYGETCDRIEAIQGDRRGNTWYSGHGRSMLLDGRAGTYYPYLGNQGAFMAKTDSNNVIKSWLSTYNKGETQNVSINDMALDAAGSMYFSMEQAGICDTVFFTDVTGYSRVLYRYQLSSNPNNLLLAKVDSNGVYQWQVNGPGAAHLVSDGLGTLYALVGASFLGGTQNVIQGPVNQTVIPVAANFPGTQSDACYQYALVRIDTSGFVQFVGGIIFTSCTNGVHTTLNLDDDGNIYVGGVSEGSTYLVEANGNVVNSGLPNIQSARKAALVAKFSPQGTVLWNTNFTALDSRFMNVAVANEGVYVTGAISGLSFSLDICKNAVDCHTFSGKGELFLAKLDTAGNFRWIRRSAKNSWTRNIGLGVGKDRADEVYWLFTRMNTSSSPNVPFYLDVSATDSVLITSVNQQIYLDNCLIARYDTAGVLQVLTDENFGQGTDPHSYQIFDVEVQQDRGVRLAGAVTNANGGQVTWANRTFVTSNDDGFAVYYRKNLCTALDFQITGSAQYCAGSQAGLQVSVVPPFQVSAGTTYSVEIAQASATFTGLATVSAVLTGNTLVFTVPAGLQAGVPYKLRLVSSGPSSFSNAVYFTVVPPLNATNQQLGVCTGGTLTLQAGGGAGSYLWKNGAGTFLAPGATYVLPNVTDSGLYYCDKTNACGVFTDTFSVYALPLPAVWPLTADTLCMGEGVDVSLAAGTGVVWQPATGVTQTGASVWRLEPVANTAYAYTVQHTQTGCQQSATLSLTVHALPQLPATQVALCTGDTAQITLPVGVGAVWSPQTGQVQAGAQTYLFSPAQSTQYQAQLSDALTGCAATDTMELTVNALPAPVLAQHTDTLCAGDGLPLVLPATNTYTWTPAVPGGPVNYMLQPQQTTTYGVAVQDMGTGCVSHETLSVWVHPLPAGFGPAADTLCAGDTALLAALPGNNAYTWQPSATGTDTNGNWLFAPANTTTYEVTIEDAQTGCSLLDSFAVWVHALPPGFAAEADTVCAGDTALLAALAGNYAYVWAPAAQVSTDANGNWLFTPATGTLYQVYIEDAQTGCLTVDSFAVQVNPLPTVTLSQGNGTLTATVFPAGSYGYRWYQNGNLLPNTTASITAPGPGIFEVWATDNATGCTQVSNPVTLNNVGLQTNAAPTEIRLYPNPARNHLTVEFTEQTLRYLRLVDISGRELPVAVQRQPGSARLDVSPLAAGTYWLRIGTQEGREYVRKFVKTE